MATTKTKKARGGDSKDEDLGLKIFYGGEAVPCPLGCGGLTEVVRISTLASGGGEVWFECTSCAQRAKFEPKPATPAEKKKITQSIEGGSEPLCARHAHRTPLRRRGRQLVCPACGVLYRE